MPIIKTDELQPGVEGPFNRQVYNGLDTCITLEVFEELSTLSNQPPAVYDFERALQAPALAMMLRGFAVDEYERQKGLAELRIWRVKINDVLQQFARAVWDKGLGANSPKQLLTFFYDVMKLPKQWIFDKGVRRLSMNREVLEKLEIYIYARPIISCILAIRDIDKQIQDFEQLLDDDGRFRTSFNIAGTETWRFSSSKSSTGTGGNLQNKKRDDDLDDDVLSMRRPFIADPGGKLLEIDLEQAESREVGWLCGTLFNDWKYLDACEGGDLHTTVARMTWPDLRWTGDAKKDRAIADTLFYRNYSYRDMAKKLGHGSSYYGQPPTMARHAKIPVPMVAAFQRKFFDAFPGIPKWHQWTATQLQTTHKIINSFGVSRTFFGRPGDDTTLREAIAHSPQSSTAMRTNLGMWRIWYHMRDCELRAQKHDSVTLQYPADANEKEIVERASALMSTKLTAPNGRVFDVPTDCKIGFNWGKWDEKLNPDGMKKWKGLDSRQRLTERIL